MKVTKKTITANFTVDNVKQVGSKQLFKAYNTYYGVPVYYSYRTIIAIKYNGNWWVTSEKFSSTTSRHKSEIQKLENNCITVDSIEFERIVEGCRLNSLIN